MLLSLLFSCFFFKVVVGIPFFGNTPILRFFPWHLPGSTEEKESKRKLKLGFMISKMPSPESFTRIRPTQGGIGPMRVESGPEARVIRRMWGGIGPQCEWNQAHTRWNRVQCEWNQAHTRWNGVQCEWNQAQTRWNWNQAPWEWDQAHARGNQAPPKAGP